MSTNFYLTDEDSEIAGYKRAKIANKSDNCSLVQSFTSTVTNPASQPNITRVEGGSVLQWLTDPLATGVIGSGTSWLFNIWALENSLSANTGLQFTVQRWIASAQPSFLSVTTGIELGIEIQNYNLMSGLPGGFTLNNGDRLLFTITLSNVGGSVSGYYVQVSYNGFYGYGEGDTYIQSPDNIYPLETVPPQTIIDVYTLLKDQNLPTSYMGSDEIINSIKSAISEYSRDKPRNAISPLYGDGASYSFPLPREWINGFSEMIQIEYPVQNQIPTIVDLRYFKIWETVIGIQPVRLLRLLITTPDSYVAPVGQPTDPPNSINGILYLTYTTTHKHNTVNNTIITGDYQALTFLAASYAALIGGTNYAKSTDSLIQADAVNYNSRVRDWKLVSDFYRTRYDDAINIGTETSGAGHQENWDTYTSWGQDRLIKRRQFR